MKLSIVENNKPQTVKDLEVGDYFIVDGHSIDPTHLCLVIGDDSKYIYISNPVFSYDLGEWSEHTEITIYKLESLVLSRKN